MYYFESLLGLLHINLIYELPIAISNDGMSSSESVGFYSQFGDSVKGILTGFALIPLSIFLIFKVETCTQAGDAFKNAKPVTQMEEGKPVYITGKLSA